MVFEVQIHFVQEYPGVPPPLPVLHDAVLDGLQGDDQGRGPELLSHLVEVQHHDPAVHVDVAGVGEHVQAALGDQLGGQGDLPGLRVHLPHDLVSPVRQQRHGGLPPAAEIGLVDVGGTAVNDGLVASGEPPHAHLLLQNAGDDFGLHGNGVLPVPVVLRHFQGVDMVLAMGRDFDNFPAQGAGQGPVLPFGVYDDNIVIGRQGHVFHSGFHRHGLAGAGDAQVEGVGRDQALAVADQQILGNGVDAVGQSAGVLYLLDTEGHEDGGALGGEGPQGLHPAQAVGQDGV